MIKYRYYCDECQNEFEIGLIHDATEELKFVVCTFCSVPEIDDWFFDDIDDE